MVGVIRRMNKLTAKVVQVAPLLLPPVGDHLAEHGADPCQKLVKIRCGPGAAVLPKDVTRIHMEFAHKLAGGHMGPRKFWREALPRLKYWNPAVPMIVNRTTDQAGPAKLTLYFREPGAAPGSEAGVQQLTSATDGFSKAPPPAEGERVVTIDMKNRRSEAILHEFLQKSGATAVEPTPRDEAQLREVEELKARSNVDRARVKKMIDAQKREKAMIAAAHSEAAAIRAEI